MILVDGFLWADLVDLGQFLFVDRLVRLRA